MNHLLKKARAALCALALLMAFSNCEKEEIGSLPMPQQEVESPFKIRTVSISDIPKLTHYLESKMGRPINGLHSKDTVEGAIFDEDNVLEVIDSLGNQNYSFYFRFPDKPNNIFFNLVIGIDSYGQRTEPYIIRYVCNESQYPIFEANNYDFDYFIGTINMHKLTDYFEPDTFSNRDYCPPQYDSNGDPIPCETVNSPTGGTGGGGGTSYGNDPGGTTTNGTGTTSGTGDGTQGWNNYNNSGNNNESEGDGGSGSTQDNTGNSGTGTNTTGGSTSSGDSSNNNNGTSGSTGSTTSNTGGGMCAERIVDYYVNTGTRDNPNYSAVYKWVLVPCAAGAQQRYANRDEGCPECPAANTGAVGVNTKKPVVETCLGIGIMSDYALLTSTQQKQVTQFLLNNGCSEKNNAFAVKAIEAWLNNGEVDFEDQIINELTGKAKCVYDKLASTSTGFANAIKKFDGEFPVAHLKFVQEDLGSTRGETRAPDGAGNSPDYIITIVLNNNSNVNGIEYRPNLLVAKTLAHEVIHAEIFRKLLSLAKQGNLIFSNWSTQQQTDCIQSIKNNFPGLFDYYTRYNWNTSTPNNSQHQAMATHYRETLARILQEYDTGVAVSDNQQPQQLYMDLSWEGLRYANIHTWSNLTTETEKNRINAVISGYIAGNNNQTCTQ